MEIMEQYAVPIVMAICLAVGYIVKHVITTDKINRFIPLIVGVLGVGINMWVNWGITPDILLGGLASGLASTGLYEMVRNATNKEDTK